MRDIDTVIFDLGGVLMVNGRHSDLVQRFPPEHAEAALRLFVGDYGSDTDHPWHQLERGEISFPDFQALIGPAFADAGLASIRPPIPATEVPAGSRPAPPIVFQPSVPMINLVGRLREAGLQVGILTNNVREFRELWRSNLQMDLFDDVVDSHEVGLRKPNRAIYELALTRLSAVAGRTAFLDDVLSNVEAANAMGIHGVLVDVDHAPAVAAVERLAGLTGT